MELSKEARAAFESYMRNEMPTAREFETAPRLNLWSSVVQSQNGEPCIRLQGEIYGAAGYREGALIQTSPVIWLNAAEGWARTASRIYGLGAARDGDGAR